MSFSAFSHRVHNPALPLKHRVSALRSCAQLYRPIGFQATLSFLEELAGPFTRDDHALLRAHDHLTASRALWHEHLHRYAEQRRTAKSLGHRTPRAGEVNPNGHPPIWYGAPQRAARHALHHWRRKRLPGLLAADDPGTREINLVVSACLEGSGALTADQRHLLESGERQVRDRVDKRLYDQDVLAYDRARDLLRAAAFVRVADPDIQTVDN